jgi:signal transduction histidine kinase
MAVFRPLAERRTYRELAFLLSGGPFAVLWFGLLLGGWLATVLLSVTPLVVPALFVFRATTRLAALVEAAVARTLLGVDVRIAPPAPSGRGYWGRIRAGVSDGAFWSRQAYLLLRVTLGFALAVGIVSLIATCALLIALPIFVAYRWDADVFSRHIHAIGVAFAFLPVGLAGLVGTAWLVRGLGTAWGRLARALLPGGRATTDPSSELQAALRTALPIHAAVYAGLNTVLIVIWALTSRSTFWPEWTLMALALPLAVHAWAVFVDRGDPRRIARTRALAIHLGASSAVFLFLVGIWAVTARAYFWPVWPAIGLAIAVGVHALFAMTRRIDVLTETRAGAVETAEHELRRIERDLHDGAQARLVALGMSLGLAEQKLGSDPEAAARLLAEARTGAGEALRELRDLARGIHPPVLSDRGVRAAVGELAARSSVPVEVAGEPGTLDPAVETAAYFICAEAIANATKHGAPSRIDVRFERRPQLLALEIVDDGRGGADPSGGGLTGLRHRAEALDGILEVTSPPGGPTRIHAELPCA